MDTSTIVVFGRTALDRSTVELARSQRSGVRVVPIAGLAERLAGGFACLVDSEALTQAVGKVLDTADAAELGDLHEIRELPGLRRTVASTLSTAWDAGYDLDLNAASHPRIAALARIEAAAMSRLPPSQMRPADLIIGALANMKHAPHLVGATTFTGFPDLPKCWLEVVTGLAKAVPVTWDGGPLEPPEWLKGTAIKVVRAKTASPEVQSVRCSSARHEVLEAMRWTRSLLASGFARPREIAFAAASTASFDDVILSAAEEANLPLHFAHGRGVLHTPEGQAAAALADVLLRGLSRERVLRLAAVASAKGTVLASLPEGWRAHLPSDAPLATAARWHGALRDPSAAATAAILLPIIDILAKRGEAAAQAGELLLRGAAREIWRRAMANAPGAAVEHELTRLRAPDTVDPEASIAWMPAETLAACPRPFVWLLGLNAQSWPRTSSDDPLLPEHIVGFRLRGTTLSNDDRRSHDAILASTEKVVVRSLSRRDATGRKLGVSPLVEGEVEDMLRTRVPKHAMSEPDRLLARPSEFADSPGARLAAECWHAWLTPEIGAHDGLVASEHPAILRALARTQSATSLALLLRNPLGFMWRYALGMQAPEMDEDPVELDHLAFGNLVHEVLERGVTLLEAGNEGFGLADRARVEATVSQAVAEIAAEWDATKPIPPQLLWEMTQRRALTIVVNALTHPFPVLAGQRSFAEVPFGSDKPIESATALPWDPLAPVNVPGTEFRVGGRVDRLDLSDDASAARVVDYKSGRKHGDFVLRGGRELQRCIYAYVVGALLDGAKDVEAGLLYPSQAEGGASGNAYAPLENPAASLETLAFALAEAAGNTRAGLALPGPAAGLRYRDTRSRKDNTQGEDDPYGFALPVVPGTMLEPKKKAAAARLGNMPQFWETP